jgi:hypothetical protein
MAWIESHQSLRDHRKTLSLARLLGIKRPQAIGHLHCLWWWTLDNSQDGRLERIAAEDLAEAALWDGDPNEFVAALCQAGFLDQDGETLVVHDWDEYAGRLLDQRRRNAERQRRWRENQRRQHGAVGVSVTVTRPSRHTATGPDRTGTYRLYTGRETPYSSSSGGCGGALARPQEAENHPPYQEKQGQLQESNDRVQESSGHDGDRDVRVTVTQTLGVTRQELAASVRDFLAVLEGAPGFSPEPRWLAEVERRFGHLPLASEAIKALDWLERENARLRAKGKPERPCSRAFLLNWLENALHRPLEASSTPRRGARPTALDPQQRAQLNGWAVVRPEDVERRHAASLASAGRS